MNNALTGTGTVLAKMGAPADTFAFGSGAGTAFGGLVELADGKFALAGTNTTALTSATLQLDPNNTTTVGLGTQSIGGLTLNGGTAIFATTVPSDTVSPANISTGTLTLTSGKVQIAIPNSATPPASFAGPGSPSTLLQQDDGVLDRLISATSVSGSAGGLTLIDQNGVPVPATVNVNIAQGGNTVAVGSYGYGLSTGPANNGLYVSYGLTQLDLQAGQTLTLSGDDGTPAGSELHAGITGAGNLAIDATNTITLNNPTNSYTGTTTVTGGTLDLGVSGALGKTSSLNVNSGAVANINGTTQSVGALDISGSLDLAGGSLSTSTVLGSGTLTTHPGSTVNLGGGSLDIANGGTTAPGSLTGGGSLNIVGGTLDVSGANPGLTASTTIASGASAILNNGGGLGTGPIADDGSLIFNAATGDFSNNISGTGAVSLTNGSNIIATGTIASSGPKTIDAGSTLQLGDGGSSGAIVGDVTNNGALVFDRSDVSIYANVISGSGSVTQAGSGTTILDGNNTYTGGTTVGAGILQLTNPAAAGTGAIQVNSGAQLSLLPIAGAGFVLNNALTGTGTVFAKMGAPADTFAFGSGAGTAFGGLVELADGKFALAGTNTTALTSATLQLDPNNTTTVGLGTQSIGGLTLNGGTAIFATTVPSDTVSPANISTGTLTLTSGKVQIAIPNSATPPASFAGPGSPSTLLQQDDGVLDRLISATSVSGSAGGLTLIDQNGVPVPATVNVNIAQGGNTVAVGSYGYGLSTGPANNGLYVSYGLTQLDLQAGQTLTLSGDDGTPAGSELHAGITGAGNLAIDATNTITLNNPTNSYTGTTTVTGGTLDLGVSGALGKTSSLNVNSGAVANINGTTQSVGALDISGSLDLAGGSLSTSTVLGSGTLTTHPGSTVNLGGGSLDIANGGTTAPGSLTGGGSLNIVGGTLDVSGANPGLTASTTIASGASAILNNGGGLGTGPIADDRSLIFSAATGDFANNISGTGAVSLTNGSNIIATGTIASSGPKTIDAGSKLQLGDGGSSGAIVGDVTNNGALVFDRSDVSIYANVISGSGSVTQAGPGTTILDGDNTYSGGTTIAAGTLAIGDSTHSGATLSGGGLVNVLPAGTLGGYGSVTGPVTNQGTIAVADAVSALAGGPVGNFTINGNFTNAGVAQVGGAAVGNTLTVNGNYIGQSGAVSLNTFLGTDGSPSDKFIINGGTASGTTGLGITNIGGPGTPTSQDGIMVVQTLNGATTAPGAFALNSFVGAGAFEYYLYKGGNASGTAEDWFLRNTLVAPPTPPVVPPTQAASPSPLGPLPPPRQPTPSDPNPPRPVPTSSFPLPVPTPADPSLPPPVQPAPPTPGATPFIGPVIPLYRPEVATYAVIPPAAGEAALATLGTFHERRGEQSLLSAGEDASAAWGRVFGQSLAQNWTGTVSPSLDGSLYGIQAGLDILRRESDRGDRDIAGVFLGYTALSGDVNGFALGWNNLAVGKIDLNAASIGAYWTHIAPSGWYVDGVLMGSFFGGEAKSNRGIGVSTDGTGVTASIEGGYPIPIASDWVLEPQAQLIWQHIALNDQNDGFSTVSFGAEDAWTGRAGFRLQGNVQTPTGLLQPYLKANIWHQLSRTENINFGTDNISTAIGGTALELGGGVAAAVTKDVSLFASASYSFEVAGEKQRMFQGNVGLHVKW
ncbi:autotransporter domain-containing protein [Mesorhizobium sp. AR07]|nr:autotransporter domain-containing protein [Mesorhizobium sp. AR07]UVK42947.1 autotransporter domain-containing protein [Mesorhizobium sp. AR07]